MKYCKPWLSLDEQADLLAERGLEGERCFVVEHLRDVGYYHHGRTGKDLLSMGFRPGWQESPFWKPWILATAFGDEKGGEAGSIVFSA